MFKKTVSVIAVTLILVTGTFAPKRADAVIGAPFTPIGIGYPIVVAGAVSFVAGVAMFDEAKRSHLDLFLYLGGTLAVAVGLILMDNEGGQDLAFHPLSTGQAQQLALTATEAAAYNDEIEEINLIRETVLGHVIQAQQKGLTLTPELISTEWHKHAELLSPEAFRALERVSSEFATAFVHSSK